LAALRNKKGNPPLERIALKKQPDRPSEAHATGGMEFDISHTGICAAFAT
jgi:hypothetical protein